METLSKMFEQWCNTSEMRREVYLELIAEIVPGATTTTGFTSDQMFELIHRLSDKGYYIGTCVAMWKEVCKRERAAAFTAELREIITTACTRGTPDTDAPGCPTDGCLTDGCPTGIPIPATDIPTTGDVQCEQQPIQPASIAPPPVSPYDRVMKWKVDNTDNIRQWCTDNNVNYYTASPAYAAAHGLMNVLDDCLASNFEFHAKTTRFAISGGHLNVVKWLREHNKLDNSAEMIAVEFDQIHILKYLIREDNTVMGRVLNRIVELGRLKMLQLLAVSHNVDCASVRDIAVKHGQTEMVEWIDLVI